MESILSEIIFDTTMIFIIIGAFFGLAFGIGLLVNPELTLRLNEKLSTKISMRQKTRNIEVPIKSEAVFYKHARISGSVLMLGAAYVIYSLLTFDIYSIIPLLPKTLDPFIWQWLLDATQLFFLVSCVFIFFFGVTVFIRPSALKNFEAKANTWISTRKGFQGMNADINFLNKLVLTYPRASGVYISIFALIVLVFLLPLFI